MTATIRDVAKKAGVSCSTVSRALMGNVPVKENTKRRIFEAVKEVNYRPVQSARALKMGRTKTLQLILPNNLNPFYPKLLNCLNNEIKKYGYATFLSVSNDSKEEEKMSFQMARSFSVDGIIYLPTTDDCNHMGELVSANIPTVIINRVWDLGFPCVSIDNQSGAYRTVEYLIQNGHRRIACFLGDISLQHMREREAGCRKAFRDYGIREGEARFLYGTQTYEVYEKMCSLMKEKKEKRITGCFASSDWMAVGMYSAIMKSGLSIPGDISVVGFDDIEDARFMIPPLTTWHHPVEQIAKVAVDLLIRQIEKGEDTKEKIIIPSKIVERESVRRI